MKNIFRKSLFSLIKLLSVFIITITLIGFSSYLYLDWQNIKVDIYNFGQLEKAKPILESIPENAKKFAGLKNFNDLYKANIKPIENCYHISNHNGNQKYIF